jgi:hypothetical protein
MVDKYKDLIEDIVDIGKELNIVFGCVDIKDNILIFNNDYSHHYSLIGRGDESSILEALENYEVELEDGEYEFKAVLKWYSEDYYQNYLSVEYIEFNFIQTLLQRERQIKLESLDFLNPF